jgi:VWFA-related protein
MPHRLLVCCLVMALLAGHAAHAQSPAQRPTFSAGTELVVVNVVVRDKNGSLVRGLKKSDFTVLEDSRQQWVERFDFEELEKAPVLPQSAPTTVLSGSARPSDQLNRPAAPTSPAVDLRGRRLLVFFFDLSSMQPEDIGRATAAARDYVDHRLAPADLVGVVSFSTALRIDQDLTADRDALLRALSRFGGASGQGFDLGTTGDSEGTPDDGGAFTVDDTEYNIFENDRRLLAIQSVVDSLGAIDQKKSVIYFSSGLSQSGQDNQVQLRRTINRAVRANVSIYAADMRGLQAVVPGGEARQASLRGQAAYSGASVTSQFDQLAASQDTLVTLGEDTGGRAFLDTNSFDQVFTRVVADTSAYYVLGYASTNPARDGRFRKIVVRLNRLDLKLEYRPGYYAARDFAHSTKGDRDQQLQDQLLSDVSATDLSSYLSASYFRLEEKRYFVSLSLVVPGSQLPLTAKTSKSSSTIDILGVVEDQAKRPAGRIRDTIQLTPSSADEVKRKLVQYETGLELAPGKYRIMVALRENVSGAFGAYETMFVVPDLSGPGLKLSSVVLGTQLKAGAPKDAKNPLAQEGRTLVPNITHVVTPSQHLYFYYEVYDPAGASAEPGAAVNLATSITFFRGGKRAFETPPVDARALTLPDRKAVAFQFDVPASELAPGVYTCQINVIDDTAGAFAFPRFALRVR